MAHDPDNPFAPPAAALADAPEGGAPGPGRPATAAHRLTAALIGLALGFAAYTGSAIAGQILSETLGIAARLSAWEPMDYAVGAAALALYTPFALRRLARTGQTLPLRMLGLRFARPDGAAVEAWRIVLFHGLPTAVVFWAPGLAAGTLRLGGPLDATLRFAGLVILCANALSAARGTRETWLDQVAGFRVVKA